MPKFIFTILFSSLLFSNLFAQSTINVPGDFSTIQGALNNAGTGDKIIVSPGTYYENLFWPDIKGIHLISSGDSTNTVIDGGQNSCVVYMYSQTNTSPFEDTDTTVISGFTIKNGGNVDYGGGIFTKNFHLKINKCSVSNNSSSLQGSGIYSNNSLTHITNSQIHNNTAKSSGAGFHSTEGISYIDFCDFYSNTGSKGAGLYARDDEIHINNSNFFNNKAVGSGGGIFLSYSLFSIADCEIFGNDAPGGGAGLVSSGGNNLEAAERTITRVKVYDNYSADNINYSAGLGGGILLGGTTYLTDSEIFNNTSERYGGGLCITGPGNVIRNCIICNNKGIYGGGLSIHAAEEGTTVQRSYFANNSAHYGGGVYFHWATHSGLYLPGGNQDIDFSNNTITENSASYKGGGIYYHELDSSLSISNCTIISNTSKTSGGIYSEEILLAITNSNFADNGYAYINDNNNYLVDCSYNYWGDESGPYSPAHNPSGQGDSVTNFVNISSWSATPITNAPPIPPLSLNLTKNNNDAITLTWNKSLLSDLSHYKIYYDSDSTNWQFSNSVDNITDTTYIFTNLSASENYYFAVTTIDQDGNESWFSKTVSTDSLNITSVEDKKLPNEYTLAQNYPNPFNPATKINFTMPEDGFVELNVYNILGQKVAQLINNRLSAGYHTVEFNGSSLASGIYIYRINVGGKFNAVKKMIMLK